MTSRRDLLIAGLGLGLCWLAAAVAVARRRRRQCHPRYRSIRP